MASDALKRHVRRLAGEWAPLRWLVRGGARVVAPRHPVGAVGAVFDEAGRVLIVEHVFRTDFPWGLPGGWVEAGEDPRDAVARELREELGLSVEVRDLVHCAPVGRVRTSTHPVHLALAYYCRLLSAAGELSMEALAFEWIEPARPGHELAPFQQTAIERAARLHSGALFLAEAPKPKAQGPNAQSPKPKA